MMHCPTFGPLASLKYLKTCFQKTFLKYLKTFIKCIKILMKWLKHLSNLEWHRFQDAHDALPNLWFTRLTKISQDIYQMYQDIDEMAQTFIKSGMALVSGCPKHSAQPSVHS